MATARNILAAAVIIALLADKGVRPWDLDAYFPCKPEGGVYVYYWDRCDGVKNCYTGRDEEECDAVTECPPRYRKCSQGNRCIPFRFFCDGEEHCPGGFDEANCTHTCSARDRDERNRFQCAGQTGCQWNGMECNGYSACTDGLDEVDCDKLCDFSALKHLCRDGKTCLDNHDLCDGRNDCPDGDDEEGCPVEDPCKDTFTFCLNETACATFDDLCDGEEDCPDGDDEEFCEEKKRDLTLSRRLWRKKWRNDVILAP